MSPFGENFYYLTYEDKIWNLKGYVFKKIFTIKKWDGLPVFTQEPIYHIHTEMRQSLLVIEENKFKYIESERSEPRAMNDLDLWYS